MQHTPGPIVVALALGAGLPAQGVQWQTVNPPGAQPDLVAAAMASDPVRGRIVLFGSDAATSAPQTWEWDGASWRAMAPAAQPPVRYRGAMAYDPARNRILVFGLATSVGLGGLGMPACQLLVTPDVLVAMQPAPGQLATWSLHVPSSPALAGAMLHLQGAVLSAGGAGPLGGAMSQRLTATAGVR